MSKEIESFATLKDAQDFARAHLFGCAGAGEGPIDFAQAAEVEPR